MKYLKNTVTLELAQDRCTGCGLCTEVCPHQVFEIKDKKAQIVDRDKCMECGACQINCAFGAIHVDSGVGCASAIITGMMNNSDPVCGCGDDSSGGCC